MNTLRAVTLLALITVAANARAVETEAGVRFVVGAPVGEFGDAVDNEGFGLDGHLGLRLRPSLTVGLGLQAMIYGSETRSYRLPLVEEFDLNTSNYLAGSFLFAQWRPLTGAVQPYVEARVGFNYLWTESKLEDQDWWDDDEVARKTNYDDFATYWGGGGGLLIRLVTADRAESRHGVFLDLKATYQQGAEAEYLTEGDITFVGDVPVFSPSQSRTDMASYQLGVVVTF
ncbi:MAG: hypothetical protein IPK64_18490 [bacterium]|nr:hypothetical protein [bacterium]